MLARLRLVHLFVSLFLFTSFTAAWPWPPSLPEIDGLIYRRQDDSSKSGSASPSKTAASNSVKATTPPTSASGSIKGSITASKGGSAAATSGGSASASGTDDKAAASASATETGEAAQTTDVDPRLPPGGVNMITPAPLSTTYYKIGDYVTFAWNYTSLSVTPSRVDILVSCSANDAMYTISSNASFVKSQTILWDTEPDASGTAPLLTETYTLIVHDAAKDISATPEAGHLGSYNQFYFGMYVPQVYTPRSEWKCAVCSAALSDTERQALKFMFGMSAMTVLSFTWFVGGFGAFL